MKRLVALLTTIGMLAVMAFGAINVQAEEAQGTSGPRAFLTAETDDYTEFIIIENVDGSLSAYTDLCVFSKENRTKEDIVNMGVETTYPGAETLSCASVIKGEADAGYVLAFRMDRLNEYDMLKQTVDLGFFAVADENYQTINSDSLCQSLIDDRGFQEVDLESVAGILPNVTIFETSKISLTDGNTTVVAIVPDNFTVDRESQWAFDASSLPVTTDMNAPDFTKGVFCFSTSYTDASEYVAAEYAQEYDALAAEQDENMELSCSDLFTRDVDGREIHLGYTLAEKNVDGQFKEKMHLTAAENINGSVFTYVMDFYSTTGEIEMELADVIDSMARCIIIP